jgi:biopolymer transport protein TolQ
MDIPVVDMIMRAGWVARGIVILLGFFSVITWAIILNRLIVINGAAKGNKRFLKKYQSITSLTDIEKFDGSINESPMGELSRTGLKEYRRILDDSRKLTGARDWSFILESQFGMTNERMDTKFSEIMRKFDSGIILLAIASSVAPFIGLLGTVWGIMNSFFEIGNQGSASLPVVAPGIAEALIATVMGLAVAIPAVFFYNYFVHKVDNMESQIDEFKNLMFSHLKRDILNVIFGEKTPK